MERAASPAEGLRVIRRIGRGPALRPAPGRRASSPPPGRWRGPACAARRRRPLNVPIGPHRRYGWVDADRCDLLKAIKNGLGGTVNDVVLTTVALALGRFLRRRGVDDRRPRPEGRWCRSRCAPTTSAARSATRCRDVGAAADGRGRPAGVLRAHPRRDGRPEGVRPGGRRRGADRLADFAPPTILSQAARLQARQRFFNLVVTNVPGPQIPLYLLGRRMLAIYPVVPLAPTTGAGHRDHELLTGASRSACWPTTTRFPTSATSSRDMEGALFDLGRAAETERHPLAHGRARHRAHGAHARDGRLNARLHGRRARTGILRRPCGSRSRRSTPSSATSRATSGSCARGCWRPARPAPRSCSSRSSR